MQETFDQISESSIVELPRYQPLMAITDERLECDCGSLAIFLLLVQNGERKENVLCLYCQKCFEAAKR